VMKQSLSNQGELLADSFAKSAEADARGRACGPQPNLRDGEVY